MNKLVLSLCFCLFAATAFAQTCNPDLTFQDSAVGVYPLPYNEITMVGGLDTACQNNAYETVVTFVIPETVELNGFNLDLEFIELETTGAVVGLPEGLTYACNPPDCFFEPMDTLACMILYGTPTDDIGRYELTLNGTVKTSLITADLNTLLQTINPNPYYIDVFADGDPNCGVVNTTEALANYSMTHQPNPVSGMATIQIEAAELNEFTLSLTDMMGRLIETRSIQVIPGVNTFEMYTDQLASGLYFYTLENNQGKLTRKMLVSASN